MADLRRSDGTMIVEAPTVTDDEDVLCCKASVPSYSNPWLPDLKFDQR